jgi:hypothetical protein
MLLKLGLFFSRTGLKSRWNWAVPAAFLIFRRRSSSALRFTSGGSLAIIRGSPRGCHAQNLVTHCDNAAARLLRFGIAQPNLALGVRKVFQQNFHDARIR